MDSLRKLVKEHSRQNLPQNQNLNQNQHTVQGMLGLSSSVIPNSGSARKAFPAPLGSIYRNQSPMGKYSEHSESIVPTTPIMGRRSEVSSEAKQNTVGYRSPGFGSGPSYAYGLTATSTSTSTSVPSTIQSMGGSSSKPRRSAYMAQASPAGRKLTFGQVGSGSGSGSVQGPSNFNSNSTAVTVSTGGTGAAKSPFSRSFSTPSGFSSPIPSRNVSQQSTIETPDRFDRSVDTGLSDADVSSYEAQLNAQQRVLEIAAASIVSLEDRIRFMREQKGMR